MNVSNPSVRRILHWQHRQISATSFHGSDSTFKCFTGHSLRVWKHRGASLMRVCTKLSLKGYFVRFFNHFHHILKKHADYARKGVSSRYVHLASGKGKALERRRKRKFGVKMTRSSKKAELWTQWNQQKFLGASALHF